MMLRDLISKLFSSQTKREIEENIVEEDIEAKVKEAIKKGDLEELNDAVADLLDSNNLVNHIDLLNELLLNSYHLQHQYIAKAIQSLETPSSVPFIDKVLETNFEGIPYTGSDSYSMAKWFSWALSCIRTKEAVEVLVKHAGSKDKGIKYEMRYRLKKMKTEGKL